MSRTEDEEQVERARGSRVTPSPVPRGPYAAESDREKEASDNAVGTAVKKGLARGFVSGVQTEIVERGDAPSVGRAAPAEDVPLVPGLSPLSMVARLADDLDKPAPGLSPEELEERMDRFPELRGVEMATGNAARFPELVETGSGGLGVAQQASAQVSEDDYDR